MISAYIRSDHVEHHTITQTNLNLLNDAMWIDIVSPSPLEKQQVEEQLGIDIPTRDDMIEIELSSRLYKENGIYFMTAIMIARHDSEHPILDPVSFIVTPTTLITVRYIDPRAFKLFSVQLHRHASSEQHSVSLLIDLLDAASDRLADALELVGHRIDDYSRSIFRSEAAQAAKFNFNELMHKIGASGDLNTKARESLMTFARLISFLRNIEQTLSDNDKSLKLAALAKDLDSLSDHANFLSTKINFLLDATLGMVTIEQNNIIKIFSVASVMFLPPTLIASIYGMNFHHFPELDWTYGYAFALVLMVIAAWLPYKYFKHRQWL